MASAVLILPNISLWSKDLNVVIQFYRICDIGVSNVSSLFVLVGYTDLLLKDLPKNYPSEPAHHLC